MDIIALSDQFLLFLLYATLCSYAIQLEKRFYSYAWCALAAIQVAVIVKYLVPFRG